MRVNRGLLGWGVFFIIAGSVPLAVQAGLIDEALVRRAWQLWPLILIGIGLGLVLQRTKAAIVGGLVVSVTLGLMVGGLVTTGFGAGIGLSGCGFGPSDAGDTAFPDQAGSLGSDARVSLEIDCGDLTLDSTAGTGWTVRGLSDDGRPPAISSGDTRLDVRSPERSGFGAGGSTWRITLPADPAIAVDLSVNAGSAHMDLGPMHVPDLNVTVNAGEATIDMTATAGTGRVNGSVNAGALTVSLPAPEGTLSGSLSANLGSVEVCVPDDVAVRVGSSGSALGSIDVNAPGASHDGSTWTTPGFDTATRRIELDVSANLGSVTINPEADCD